jgi:nucleoside-diphosphate kinase
VQRTFTILKPDTVKAGNVGLIIDRLIKEGFRIRAMKMVHLTKAQAEGFYYVHKERPFFSSLVQFMSEGPIVPMVLEADNAIEKLRKVMGATDPAKADAGTIRKQFAANIERNAIHGSDGSDTAAFETGYFFNGLEIV